MSISQFRYAKGDPRHGGWKDGETGAKIGETARKVWDYVRGLLSDWKEQRSRFVNDTLGETLNAYPGHNVVIFHNTGSYFWTDDGFHLHVECPQNGGPLGIGDHTYGYEIQVFNEGEFKLKGDGGWLNWGCGGNVYWIDRSQAWGYFFPSGVDAEKTYWDYYYKGYLGPDGIKKQEADEKAEEERKQKEKKDDDDFDKHMDDEGKIPGHHGGVWMQKGEPKPKYPPKSENDDYVKPPIGVPLNIDEETGAFVTTL